jgi:hypothetical protein
MARKVALLGSTVAVLAFTCGFVGTKYLIEKDDGAQVEDLQSVQASACGNGYVKSSEACFSSENDSYFREWLLWKDVELNNDWPEAINEDEELIHSQRFDGVLPKIQHDALNALHANSVDEVDPSMLEAAVQTIVDASSTNPTGDVTDRDGEGGRRLTRQAYDPFENVANKAKEGEQASLGVMICNSYTKGKSPNTEYPWTQMVEPYRVTTLELTESDSTATYRWTIDGHVHGFGTEVEALFTDTGYHSVKVEEMIVDDNGDITTNFLVVKVMCKYVRREIRALSDLDRETWLSTIAVIQHVPTLVGQAIYGSKYMSKDAFTRVHLYYGGAMDCDHWHQGAGFVTSHVALTLQFEQALQSINPSIATPYWDFTLESTFYGARDWRESFIFADDWFGKASPDNTLHTVTEGRFQFVATLLDASKYSDWINSYGLLRAPWNNDPTPFLTRSSKVYGYENNMKPSGCKEYRASLKQTTWMAMSKQLNSAAHGHIHELMGGAWNHYLTSLVGDNAAPSIYTFAHSIQALSKVLWRYGYVNCPDSCSMTDAAADCQCTCSAESLAGKTSLEILTETDLIGGVSFFDASYHKLDSTNFVDSDGNPKDPIDGYTVEQTKHIHNNLLGLICNPGHIGDMYQATSTNDITFWTIHNTVDRLWHYKRLGNNQDYDETWDPYHKCYGHNPRNYQPFTDLFSTTANRRLSATNDPITGGNGVDGKFAPAYNESRKHVPGSFYTNEELYYNLHPTQRHLQYVYDNFDWSHCTKIGYHFTNS